MTSEIHESAYEHIAEVAKAQNAFLDRLAKAVVAELIAEESTQSTKPVHTTASEPVERQD